MYLVTGLKGLAVGGDLVCHAGWAPPGIIIMECRVAGTVWALEQALSSLHKKAESQSK